jgi:hypothetical protein
MSKHQTIKAIRSEIDRLNRDIDLCIIKGVPYRQQSMRHKFLRSQLSRLAPRRVETQSFFSRLSFISSFML